MLSWNGSPKSSILLGYLTKSTYKPFSCDSTSLFWTPPDYSSATNLMAAENGEPSILDGETTFFSHFRSLNG